MPGAWLACRSARSPKWLLAGWPWLAMIMVLCPCLFMRLEPTRLPPATACNIWNQGSCNICAVLVCSTEQVACNLCPIFNEAGCNWGAAVCSKSATKVARLPRAELQWPSPQHASRCSLPVCSISEADTADSADSPQLTLNLWTTACEVVDTTSGSIKIARLWLRANLSRSAPRQPINQLYRDPLIDFLPTNASPTFYGWKLLLHPIDRYLLIRWEHTAIIDKYTLCR